MKAANLIDHVQAILIGLATLTFDAKGWNDVAAT